jgi:hypothetical protein
VLGRSATTKITNNYFILLTMYMYNICVILTIGNKNTASINYKEIYDCKWDPMTLTNNILYTPVFKSL